MMSCLLQATESWLLAKLNLSPDVLSLRLDAKPPPTCGDLFISLYGISNGIDQPDLNRGIDLVYDIGITVTKRTRYNPYDLSSRRELLADTTSISSWIWKCVGWLHQEHLIPYNASALLTKLYASAEPFIEPLRFMSADPVPNFVGEEWFHPEMSVDNAYRKATYPYSAMTMECTLGQCRRVMTATTLRAEVTIL